MVEAAGFTVTDALPEIPEFWIEVAVTVTVVAEVTTGAVSKPAGEIVALLLALQFTVETKLPVPVTVAEHWLVWPDDTVDGEQLTLTAVTEPMLLLLPPPQAASSDTVANTSKNPSLRTRLSPSANVAGLDALRH
jgi:hypothetical protein